MKIIKFIKNIHHKYVTRVKNISKHICYALTAVPTKKKFLFIWRTIADIRDNISSYCDGEGSDVVKTFIYKCSMKII